MSRAGCPYDNAPMERYFNSLKVELISRFAFNTGEELEHAIADTHIFGTIKPGCIPTIIIALHLK